jgi:NADPH:quinone reductase-like Zn-dependent oxidoreductase
LTPRHVADIQKILPISESDHSLSTMIKTQKGTLMIIKSIVMPHQGDANVLIEQQIPAPHAKAGQVVIDVEASGVSFAEVQMLRGRYFNQPAFPFIPGYDSVGIVREVGEGVSPDLMGKRVAAITVTGGWTEQQVLDVNKLALIPEGISSADAVALVVNGVTAYQMLHRVAKVQTGQTVVVQGASGGVGTLLVQMAKIAGVHVIGSASPSKHAAVKALGASPIDYKGNLLAQVRALAPQGVDAVFDHVGGQTLDDGYNMLKRGGIVISYGSLSTLNNRGHRLLAFLPILGRMLLWKIMQIATGRRAAFYHVHQWPQHFKDDLAHVLALFKQGKITSSVSDILPLSRASEALARLADGKVTGKVVLVP